MSNQEIKRFSIFPFVLVALGLFAMIALVEKAPKPLHGRHETVAPEVFYALAQLEDHPITIYSQGVALPTTEIELATDLAGTIIELSPKLINGSFFNRGDLLLVLDPSFYETEVARAQSFLETARLSLTQAESRGATALIAEAKARVRAMESGLKYAERQLAKTKVRAPFDGRVRERRVGVGQYVTPGFPLARIYATDEMTVRLPLADEMLDLIALPDLQKIDENSDKVRTTKVKFLNESGGRTFVWNGYLSGMEGAIHERNRLQFLLSVIPHPYAGESSQPDRPLMATGQYLDAEIEGKTLKQVVKLPRYLLRTDQQILLIDEQNRLQLRKVSIAYRGRHHLYLDGGVEEGERIVLTPLGISVAGASVTPVLFDPENFSLKESESEGTEK
jgi:multidrug efflux system membrane fusion protein